MLKPKLNQEDLYLYELIRHPVLCGEFINNIDRMSYEQEFKFDYYQKEILCDFNNYVSVMAARAVGKTVSLSNMIMWLLVNNVFINDYVCYHVPGKAHAEPVFNALVRMFRTNSFLKQFLNRGTGVNQSDMTIKLNNGATLMCRIAGQSGTGVSVIGLHSPFVIVDESGYYPHGTWRELTPTVNSFTQGFRLITSGVPTGVREKNVLFHTDMENSSYTKHRISALENPRFTEEDRQRALEMYGGEESDDYIHLVLGQHGKPVFSLFDRAAMSIESYPIWKMKIDGAQIQNNLAEYFTLLAGLPSLESKRDFCIMGVDLGYTEPTAIVVLYMDSKNRLRFHARIELNKVNYFIQEKIIDWLDTKFNPTIIAIDEGSAGKSVIPRLTDHEDFIHKNFKDKIATINFSSWISLGFDADGNEIKNKTKPFAVSILQDYTVNGRLIYSSTDLEMIVELERMTYTKTPSGDIVYRTLTDRGGKRGEDHFTSALLCMALGYYLKMENTELRPRTKKLFNSRWFLGG